MFEKIFKNKKPIGKEICRCFFDLKKLNVQKIAKFRNWYNQYRNLGQEVEQLKRIESIEENQIEKIAEKENIQAELKKEKRVSSADIKILSHKEMIYNGKEAIRYDLDHNVLDENIVEIIQLFQKEDVKMSSCYVSTFSDSGSCCDCNFYSVEDLKKLQDFPSPYMKFHVKFSDVLSDDYVYSISCGTNDSRVFLFKSK